MYYLQTLISSSEIVLDLRRKRTHKKEKERHIYIYIYIYIERERKSDNWYLPPSPYCRPSAGLQSVDELAHRVDPLREKERKMTGTYIYIYIYIYIEGGRERDREIRKEDDLLCT